ncbi:DNA ligase D [Aequorivita capsosiphonis]|uniref:DNA ligase D n=1 Tax=Aequorivita capsosiphonis TaxID=487317 RepID=UPI002480C587|nr:DNA ligase D [Aequorivita capsosiphonis]
MQDGKVSLYSRNGISYNQKFKPITDELASIPHDVILDGEMVILNEDGVSDFEKLQNYDSKNSNERLRYYVFDILFLNGHDMHQLPLIERKGILPDVLEGLKQIVYCDHVEDMGTTFYNRAIEAGLEGVIAKKKDSLYFPEYRSENWLKIKAINTEDCIICGYTEANSGGAAFGSLILGMLENKELEYVGNCGSGFSDQQKKELVALFKPYISEESPFPKKINLKGRTQTWLKPKLVCEVKFSEWTKNGVMRHPVFKSLREDKNPEEVIENREIKKDISSKSKNSSSVLEIDGFSVPISNLEKIYWPEAGLRKYDLIDYYLKIADIILPYLRDRPENLHRHPNGIDKPSFYQKDNESLPEWIETVPIFSESSNKNIEYLLCQNEATLLYMANLGCIEINPWNSRIENLDFPDYTIIDLDPSEKNSFEDVIETALVAKEIMDAASIPGFLKTSGSSGLHIYIPLGGKYTYEEARDFTKLLCYLIQEKLPKITTMERSINKRNGKLYLDYLQNRRGQTIAAAYCVRPKKGATVSTPLNWAELKTGLNIGDYNILTVPERVENLGDIFFGVLENGVEIETVLEKINNW